MIKIKKLSIYLLLMLLIFWGLNFVKPKEDILLIKKYKYDSTLFTQGIEIDNKNRLIVGTGLYGSSKIGIYNIDTKSFEIKDKLEKRYFGEGITVTPNGIWQLTWKEHKAFLRDSKTFKVIKTVKYDTDGWGIAYNKDDNLLYMSDGTSTIFIRDPLTFKLIDKFNIYKGSKRIKHINELEIYNGFIYANIWKTNKIIKINIKDRLLVKTYNFSKILNQINFTTEEKKSMDVLNGIAHIKDNKFYISGKKYPLIFEVELNN